MKRAYAGIALLILAALGCSLSRTDKEGEARTPTPISIISVGTAGVTDTPNPNATFTPVSAPPTRPPTLLPTPLQFNTPVVPGAVAQAPLTNNAGGGAASNNNAPASGSGQIVASGVDPASGAPVSNGYFFPNTIVYSSGGSLRAVGRDGSGGGVIGSGNVATRSINGLFIASGGSLLRPDGTNLALISGQTTTPTWSRDNGTAYFGSGSNLMRYQNGSSAVVDSTNGNIFKVEYSPDGGTVFFASQNQLKLRLGDGNVTTRWESGSESITGGPYWATRGGQLGVYIELNNGRRLFLGGDLSEITDPNERLQLQSPVDGNGRVYMRADNGGSLTLVAVFPGISDREFVSLSLGDVSWAPDSAQLVYASPDGSLVLLDVGSGGTQVIASGGARFPVWTSPRYLVQN